ncbi:MAG: hypothetical protein Q4P30_02370 [Eubacteriales bacterium]|nr:hypothetical protein [Eubacteriales bacterium]
MREQLKLCIPERKVAPYYCRIMKREVYTVEELSYLLYENVHMIDESFPNKELIRFVRETTGIDLTGLPFQDMVLVILRSNNLYSEEDVQLVERILKHFEEGDHLLRSKMIGDKCLLDRDYQMALKHYDNIIERCEISVVQQSFLHAVRLNKGVAMARMLNFKDAFFIFDILLDEGYMHEFLPVYRLVALRFYRLAQFEEEMKTAPEEIRVGVEAFIGPYRTDNPPVKSDNNRYMLIVDNLIEEWKRRLGGGYQ